MREGERARGRGGAGRGFIPADRARDMTPVGEETDYNWRDRGGGGGAEMEERQREAGGRGIGGGGSINWFRNSFALGKV